MRINIKVDASDMDIKDVRPAVTKALAKGAENIKRTAAELAPKRTGALSESIQTRYAGPMRYEVFADMPPYDVYMEEGTRPHGIYGNPLLYWEGALHPVPYVNHPGTEAYKYMEEAMLANATLIVGLVEMALEELL